ncbi:hypothetical protein [Paenibacillus endoradicis]|uniref:hypothetical protein n=1 Tax=Paenibacillus endoradicis TaxID=2972487 RepID=UPI002159740E|nr:hypothetical protein [Paenibacillus endoradicis]MCR8659417.1 hypothetical protein [Paenibacillus endoradicis]
MSSTKILDMDNNIIEIVWDQKARPDDFDRVTREIEKFSKDMGGKFDVVVDMRSVKAFLPESQAKLVEHQKELLTLGMQRAAVIVEGAIAKIQLNRSTRQSEHTTESHWSSYEDALNFLRGN